MIDLFKNNIKLCVAVILAFTFSCCDVAEYYWSDSYIQEYRAINGLYFRHFIGESFRFIGSGRSASIKSTGEDKAWFDRICHKNGDFTYSRKVRLLAGHTDVIALTPDIVSIDVYCEDDFDALHSAGSSINDCIRITYESAFDYIVSGYEGDEPSTHSKMLSEITPEDLRILLFGSELFFVTKPEKLGIHPLRIVMKTADGKEYSDSFLYNFRQGQLTESK